MVERRGQVLQQLQQLQTEAKVILDIMENEDASKKLDGMRDSKSIMHFLQNEYGVSLLITDELQ